MTDPGLNVLPPTPLPPQPIPQQIVDIDAVSTHMIQHRKGNQDLPESTVGTTVETTAGIAAGDPSVAASASDANAKPADETELSQKTENSVSMMSFDEELAMALITSLESEGLVLAERPSVHEESLSDSSQPLALPPVQNVSELGTSNFKGYLQQHDPIKSHLLTFASDSLRVSKANQRVLRELADEFSPVSDFVSVLGCSNGATLLQNGNAILALGRAQRVQQSLMSNGVPPNRIFTEGCWSGSRRTDALPNRGAVVILFRHNPNQQMQQPPSALAADFSP